MKPKIINITNYKGEIDNGQACSHHFYGGNFSEINTVPESTFYVDVHVIDEETNTVLRIEKYFKTKFDAQKFLKEFVSKKPISEAVIIEKTEKEIYHYA